MELHPDTPSGNFDYAFRLRYETLRALLNRNGYALQLLSDLEADLKHLHFSDHRIQRPVERLLGETLLMAQELNLLSRNRYTALYEVIDQLHRKINAMFQAPPPLEHKSMVVSLDGEASFDSTLVGGKSAGTASLRSLFADSVPPGFTVTTSAYRLFLKENNLNDRIRMMLRDIDAAKDRGRFSTITESIRNMIHSANTPKAVRDAIIENARNIPGGAPSGWAVRSSATSEDSRFSFAGQFESLLKVSDDELINAYQGVLASRFTDRAVIYRLNCGFREVDTPMAVLFMPMIDPVAAGVLYTSDPDDPDADRMVLAATPGLSASVVKGIEIADTFYLSRQPKPVLLKSMPVVRPGAEKYFFEETMSEIGALGFRMMSTLGFEMDIEWAVDKLGKVWLLQGRRLYHTTSEQIRDERARHSLPLIEGGATIFPGRAEGPVIFRAGDDAHPIPKGSVLVVSQPTPDLAPLLPYAAALLAEEGSPVGHLATLVREFSIPSIFRLGNSANRMKEGSVVSIDATKRTIYEGSRWPGMKERVLSRLSSPAKASDAKPLHDAVLALNLTDPFSPAFKPGGCRSIHDAIRFIHEMSIRQMFQFGDAHSRVWSSKTRKLRTSLPMKIKLLDLESPIIAGKKEASPEELESIPFKAFWRGFADPDLAWPERWERSFGDLPADFREQVFGGSKGPRRTKDTNYLILARDYLNFNARFAYHYAMVDAFVGPGDENNYVHFRLHGGGGSEEKRRRRVRFIEWVLRETGFGADTRGDLVTAWLRRYPQKDSEAALETLGRLMVCARQLDFLMNSENAVKIFAQNFLKGSYEPFS